MTQTLLFFPGQLCSIFLDLKDSDGYRADSLTIPAVTRIIGSTLADGYTLYDGYLKTDGYDLPMTKIDTGLYFAKITLPKLATTLGSYLIDVEYTDPVTTFPTTRTYQVIINAPFGPFSVTNST